MEDTICFIKNIVLYLIGVIIFISGYKAYTENILDPDDGAIMETAGPEESTGSL